MIWPSRYLDLSVLDFFVWGRTKDEVYKNKPTSLQEFEGRIENSLESIPAESFATCLRIVGAEDGIQVELALGKK